MKTEPIDAVEMTRRIRDDMYEETRDLESEALLRYLHERSRSAVEKLERSREASEGTRLTIP